MAGVFVSYAHEDRGAAERIVTALQREGFSVWWDHEIPPGRSWDEVIGARIAAADVVIALWSARSVRSNFVKEEAQLAYEAEKLLPVRIDATEPPVGFRRVHAANLADWRGASDHRQWQALVTELRARGGGAAHAPPPQTAPRAAVAPAAQQAPEPTRGAAWLVNAGIVFVLLGAGAWFALRGGEQAKTQNISSSVVSTDAAPAVAEAYEIVRLENTTWAGVLVIGASQQTIEFRFREDGVAHLVSQTDLPQEWVWHYTATPADDPNGTYMWITGHSYRFSAHVTGDALNGTYENESGRHLGSIQLIRQN